STLYTSANGIVVLPPAMGDDYQCFWYNIPEDPSTITIYKWRCPDGMPAEKSQTWFETNCKTNPQDGVTFTMTDSSGMRPPMNTSNGMVQWTDVATGAVQVAEAVPAGFDPLPYLVCTITAPGMSPSASTPATVNGVWNGSITEH